MWLYAFLGTFFIIYGVMIDGFKRYALIYKYNRMSNEEKTHVDVVGMARFVAVVLCFDGIMLIMGAILAYMGIDIPFEPIIIVLLISLIFMTFFMQRYDGNLFDENNHFKKGIIKSFMKRGATPVIALIVMLILVVIYASLG